MYKVWNGSRTVKKVVRAKDFQDLKTKGKSKLELTELSCVVLNSDGTEIEDDDTLKAFADQVFLLLSPNETWSSQSTGPTHVTAIGMTAGIAETVTAVGYQEVNTQHLEDLHVGYQNIQKQHVHGPSGILGEQTLDAKIDATKQFFVKTQSYRKIETRLKEHGHITLCGASGEGKTATSLMLALGYRELGYKVVFVEDIEVFNFDTSIDFTSNSFLIIDDIFGKKKESQNTVKIGLFFEHLDTLMERYREASQNTKHSAMPHKQTTGGINLKLPFHKEIGVVFSSKTYNLKAGISRLPCERKSLFREETVVDLTEDVFFHYSQKEMETIFEHHGNIKDVDTFPEDIKRILDSRSGLFGFPLTCKIFFGTLAPGVSASVFFERPLPYLKIELADLLQRNDDKTGVLVLMFLCKDDRLDLGKLHTPNDDPDFEKVLDTIPVFEESISTTRTGMYNEAKYFKGTFFVGGDSLSFAHSSIYEACAREIFELNPNFGIDYCSDSFACTWLKPEIDSTEDDLFHAISVSENYHDKLAKRLAKVHD